jgi:hypothetical protein
MKKILILVCVFPNLLAAQLHDNTWMIGYQGGTSEFGITEFTFTEGNLAVKKSNHTLTAFQDLNACFSDSSGQLFAMFHGYWVMDRNGAKMKGGDSIRFKLDPNPFVFGYSSDGDIPQGGMFLPWPGHPDSLLLFYVSQGNAGTVSFVELASLHLQYALIRPSGNGGLGEVTVRRHVVLEDTIQYGRLSACKHANGRDWWLMINERNTNRWYRYLLDPAGIHLLGQQEIGLPVIDGFSMSAYSPDGQHYATFNAIDNINDYLDVYDFDRCEGFFFNHRQIHFSGEVGGVAFSPNSRYLYLSYITKLFQYDLESPDFESSQVLVDTFDGFVSTSYAIFYQPQLAPDGKIYICCLGSTKVMHVIHSPDEAGVGCQFQQHGIPLPVHNGQSLTSSPYYRLGPLDGSACDTLGLDNLPVSWWRSEQDTLDPLQVYFHDLSYYEPTEWQWHFGDPVSGVNNSSLERHPQHVFSAPGTYEVCLMVGNVNARDTLCRMLTVGSSLAENPDLDTRIQVAPNPFDSRLSVAVSSPLAQAGVIRLFDQTGRLVMQERLSFGITELNTGHLPPGMYFYSISVREEPVKAGKVVKVRGE